VVQINLKHEANPKPIFIRKILSPSKKEELINLIQVYIDVFAWNYEYMPEIDLSSHASPQYQSGFETS